MEQLLRGGGAPSSKEELTTQSVEAAFGAVWGELPEGRRGGVAPAEALLEVGCPCCFCTCVKRSDFSPPPCSPRW
jgi:hypothetical protein